MDRSSVAINSQRCDRGGPQDITWWQQYRKESSRYGTSFLQQSFNRENIAVAIDEWSTEDQVTFRWMCSNWGATKSIQLYFDYTSHEQAKVLEYPLGMMAAANTPEAQHPAQAALLQLTTNSNDPDLAPWLCWLLAGAPKLAAAELNIPRIPPGFPAMPNLAHLILRLQRTCLADIQSALQSTPNLETLLLGQDWCSQEPSSDDSTAWDITVPPRLRHLFLENIYPSALSLPEGCTVGFSGQLRELDGMFGAAAWNLRGGCLKMLDAFGYCNGGFASKYSNVAANLGSVEVLRLRESPFCIASSAALEWSLGLLPAESTARITTLHISAQEVAVTVPLWPALRHVKLDAHMTLSLDFEDVKASAAALESFEYSDNVKERAGLKRLQSVLAAQGRRIVSKGRGYKAPKALEQPADGVTDVSELCCCGCCTGCLFGAGALPDARSVREIVPLRSDGHQGESDFSLMKVQRVRMKVTGRRKTAKMSTAVMSRQMRTCEDVFKQRVVQKL